MTATNDLRTTKQHLRLEASYRDLLNNLDHHPDDDPDELVPRWWESRIALDFLDYVREWDLPEDVASAAEALYEWLRDEHEAHRVLLERGRI